jgi:pimeloyl-ACP methyl ester carboxylesterase
MSTIRVNDISIYYEIHGEGEPLVLIMGYGGNAGQWFCQIPGLSRDYRVIAFDNRGAGQSDKPDVPYTIQMLAQDVSGLLDALAIDAAHIYGISMGGMIAQEFALRSPDKVTSLILGCTTPGGRNSIMVNAEATALLFDMERMKRLTPEENVRGTLPLFCGQEFTDNNRNIVQQYIAKAVEHVAPLRGFMGQSEAIMTHNTYARLPHIKAPTLVIAGTADRVIPFENSRILASRIPNAELAILENVGHGFFVEAAEEANKIILDFLGRHRRSY